MRLQCCIKRFLLWFDTGGVQSTRYFCTVLLTRTTEYIVEPFYVRCVYVMTIMKEVRRTAFVELGLQNLVLLVSVRHSLNVDDTVLTWRLIRCCDTSQFVCVFFSIIFYVVGQNLLEISLFVARLNGKI